MAKKLEGYTERQIFILGRSFRLIGNKGDTYYEALLYAGALAERSIVNILAASISEDDWVIDVGANIGYISLVMSVLCPKGRVFAFEPGKTAYQLLKKNTLVNSIKNIKINQFGLSDSKRSTTLTYSLSNSAGAFVNNGIVNKSLENSSGAFVNNGIVGEKSGLSSNTIKLNRLDDEYKNLGITKCSLIKVDVEGHEPNFLKGASGFINKFKPLLIMEVNHWCLNVFNRTSLPDFIELSYKHFPYIFAFRDGDYLDLSDENARHQFYYENAVNNSFFNVYCGFDRNSMISRLNLALGEGDKTQQALSNEKQALENKVNGLEAQVLDLEEKVRNAEEMTREAEEQVAILRNSRPQKTAAKINKILGR